jgi:acyl-CoA hydrolase
MKKQIGKTRASSVVTTQKIVAGEHLNPNGTLFGGYLMCWMDEVAFMCARRYTGKPTCVTVNIDNITFRTPLRLGEHVLLSATVTHVGNTSMEIEVRVEKEDPKTLERTHTNNAHLTFVCLNKKFKPVRVPKLVFETIEDYRKNQEAVIRSKVRIRLGRFLARKLAQDFTIKRSELFTNEPSRLQQRILPELSRIVTRMGIKNSVAGLSRFLNIL